MKPHPINSSSRTSLCFDPPLVEEHPNGEASFHWVWVDIKFNPENPERFEATAKGYIETEHGRRIMIRGFDQKPGGGGLYKVRDRARHALRDLTIEHQEDQP